MKDHKRYTITLLAALLSFAAFSQNKGPWNNKQCAVVLTYDDALNVHISHVLPALDSVGLKGTFYISDYFGGLRAQIPKWKKAAAKGHELGNHTIFHPCLGNLPGRGFVSPDYDMSKYSIRRMTDEIKAMNTLLKAVDGKERRTFAYTCGDMKIRDTFFLEGLKYDFAAARAVRSQMDSLDVDLYNVSSYMVNGESGEQLIELVKQAKKQKKLLVFLFHGVGGEHSLNVSLEAHSKLLKYLKQNQKEIWTATMVDVAEYISKRKN
jgi:peptidoglycan/xylan/chitin deacetylase (PgdA/CDA1 family)